METVFWAIWKAAEPSLPSEVTAAFPYMVTGALARRQGTPLRHSDIDAWLIPGLAALGVHTELMALPAEGTLSRLSEQGDALPVFAFSHPIEQELPESEEDWNTGDLPAEAPDPTIVTQGLAVRQEKNEAQTVHWRETERQEETGSWEDFRERFSHALHVRKAERKGSRRDILNAACLRWLAYSDAFPDRVPTSGEADAFIRAQAAVFLHSIVGKRRDRVSNCLRRAAEAYEQGDVTQGIEFLRLAALQALALPAVVQAALLSDPTLYSLSDIERRELVYLARAGTRDLKALAARRLTYEADHSEVSQTLNQLRYDSDAWVRAAASPFSVVA